MIKVQHLQLRRNELQEQYDFLNKKIGYLRQSQQTEDLTPERGFKLSLQIETATKEREKIVEELDKIEQDLKQLGKNLGSEKIYRTLWRLGYEQQVDLFLSLLDAESVAGFLIHGLQYYGQCWLLNRLIAQYVPGSLNGKVVTIRIDRRVKKSGVRALWREISQWLGWEEKEYSDSEIAEGVYQWWQTQDVLLIFHNVNIMPQSSFDELLQDFWLPLARKAGESPPEKSNHKLLMFLVDYDGTVSDWDTPLAEKIDATWQPPTPLRSPKICEFSEDDLRGWIRKEYDQLPEKLTSRVNSTVSEIFQDSENGIPEFALDEICKRCGLNWDVESPKWLKY